MRFNIEHDFNDLYANMHKSRLYDQNTFRRILKKTVVPLRDELERTGPDSLKSFASSTRKKQYTQSAQKSRAKYGELIKSLGIYSKNDKYSLGEHSVNVGFLRSKGDKSFVAKFLNYGWVEAKTGKSITTKYQNFMQKAEQKTTAQMKDIFDNEVTKTFTVNVEAAWARNRMRRV